MSVESKPYFWAVCDADECGARNPDEDDDSGAEAWASAEQLFADEGEHTWTLADDGRTYCPLHAPGWMPCPSCDADGLVRLPEPLRWGTCARCDGDRRVLVAESGGIGEGSQ